jgi:ribosomal protein S18 acetylase RimI-like enzyme
VPLKTSFKKFRYAVLLGRIAGLNVLARELRRQIYSRSYYVGVEKDLAKPSLDVRTDVEYILQRGKQTDIDEILSIAKTASKASGYELVMRIMFYDSGFRNFYVARTTENGELCYIAWLLSCAEHPELRDGFKGIPPLEENEVLLFNLFAFEKYRGKGLASSVDTQLCKIAMENGYERAIAYPPANNIAAVKALEKIGFKKCCWKFERRFLFSVTGEFCSEMNTRSNSERSSF